MLASRRVELVLLAFSEFLLGRHLEQDRLGRNLDGRHRDAVVRPVVLQRVDLRVARDERERQRGVGHDALDPALRAVPQQQEIADARVDDVHAAGEQRVGLAATTGEKLPVDLQVVQPERFGLLLDEMLLFHHVRRQVQDARLPRDDDLGLLLRERGMA